MNGFAIVIAIASTYLVGHYLMTYLFNRVPALWSWAGGNQSTLTADSNVALAASLWPLFSVFLLAWFIFYFVRKTFTVPNNFMREVGRKQRMKNQ